MDTGSASSYRAGAGHAGELIAIGNGSVPAGRVPDYGEVGRSGSIGAAQRSDSSWLISKWWLPGAGRFRHRPGSPASACEVPIPDFREDAIEKHIADHTPTGMLFRTPRGNPVRRRQRQVRQPPRGPGLNAIVPDVRHSFARTALAAGFPISGGRLTSTAIDVRPP